MMTEAQIKANKQSDLKALEVAQAKMETYAANTKLWKAWEKEVTRLATRLAVWNLVLSGQFTCEGDPR